jgi:hypothetical protein
VRLTEQPASFFVFPRARDGDRFGGSLLAWTVGPLRTAGEPLSRVLAGLGLEGHGLVLYDQRGFVDDAGPCPDVETAGSPAYQVLGELFASKRLTWSVGGIGAPRSLTIGGLPP